jgi:glycogen debranching enzyme
MDTEDYYLALKDYWAYTLLEAVETLTKVFHNPEEASKNMSRLKRHADFQLQETFRIAEDTVYETATAGGSR